MSTTENRELQESVAWDELPSATAHSLDHLSATTARSLDDLSTVTARTIPSNCSFATDYSLESFDVVNTDELKDPPSFYHLSEMNKDPVPTVTRLAAVPSQYHLDELRDYQALQANPCMLKLATSKCVLNRH